MMTKMLIVVLSIICISLTNAERKNDFDGFLPSAENFFRDSHVKDVLHAVDPLPHDKILSASSDHSHGHGGGYGGGHDEDEDDFHKASSFHDDGGQEQHSSFEDGNKGSFNKGHGTSHQDKGGHGKKGSYKSSDSYGDGHSSSSGNKGQHSGEHGHGGHEGSHSHNDDHYDEDDEHEGSYSHHDANQERKRGHGGQVYTEDDKDSDYYDDSSDHGSETRNHPSNKGRASDENEDHGYHSESGWRPISVASAASTQYHPPVYTTSE